MWIDAQVAVALMESMQPSSGKSTAERAEIFAKDLHNRWGVGQKGCDDGVLLLLAVNDRQVCYAPIPVYINPQSVLYTNF